MADEWSGLLYSPQRTLSIFEVIDDLIRRAFTLAHAVAATFFCHVTSSLVVVLEAIRALSKNIYNP
jgi:hypothetical protein